MMEVKRRRLTGHVNFTFFPPFVLRCRLPGVAAVVCPAYPVLALGSQFVLGQPQPQFESLVLLPVEGQLHQVVVDSLLEEFGDLTDRGADQTVHDSRQMRLECSHRFLHHLAHRLPV